VLSSFQVRELKIGHLGTCPQVLPVVITRRVLFQYDCPLLRIYGIYRDVGVTDTEMISVSSSCA